jgi:hypothetical protein
MMKGLILQVSLIIGFEDVREKYRFYLVLTGSHLARLSPTAHPISLSDCWLC